MNANDRFQELDAIRGLAALSVLFFHFTSYEKVKEAGFHFTYGVTGVDIFFMISGFVIFLTINRTKKWQDFVVSRFSRLYPTYWACVALTGVFILLYQPSAFSISQFVANLTMFPCYFGEEDLDGTYWTLLIELLFYLWILIIFICNGLKRIIPIALCCTIGIMVFHYFANLYPNFYWFAGKKLQLINHFPLFFSGILFYKMKFSGFSVKYLLLITLCFLSTFYLHDKGGRSYQMISLLEHQSIILFYHIVFFLFIYGKLTFLIREPLLYLGKISYSLYLLHQFIGLKLMGTFQESLHLHIYVAMTLSILSCVAFADFITRYIEKPAIDHIRKWYKNKEKATSVVHIQSD